MLFIVKGSQDERFALREEILYGDEEYNIIISTYVFYNQLPILFVMTTFD